MMLCLLIPTLIYLWEIIYFQNLVSLFCCSQICGPPILGIYKSLTDTCMWKLGQETGQFPEKEYINGIFIAVHSTYLGLAWRNSCSPPCPWAWSRQSASPAPVASSRPGRWAPSPDPRRLPPPSSPSADSCTLSLPPAHQPRTRGSKKGMSSARKRRLLQRIGDLYQRELPNSN